MRICRLILNRFVTRVRGWSIRGSGRSGEAPGASCRRREFRRRESAAAEKLAVFLDRYVECMAASNIAPAMKRRHGLIGQKMFER